MEILPVATFHSPFTSKFGIPKQSGIVEQLEGTIVFTPEYRNADAIRGMEEFDYLWLIWGFSANRHAPRSLVVRPPRLGGNEKVGVFASRSPFRPNGMGLSSVRIARIEHDRLLGPVIHVLGADLMDGTPIYDIKPYVTYADSHEGARSGFVDTHEWQRLQVEMPREVEEKLSARMDPQQMEALRSVLAEDPRPQYQKDAGKVYGMPYMQWDVHFRVDGGVLKVVDCEEKFKRRENI